MILMPCAPKRMAFCIARFMARRNITALFQLLGDSVGNDLRVGFWLANFFNIDDAPARVIMRLKSARSLSMSSPFLPITTPGRALKMVIRAFLAGRSMTILLTDAPSSLRLRYSRTFRSSLSIGSESACC